MRAAELVDAAEETAMRRPVISGLAFLLLWIEVAQAQDATPDPFAPLAHWVGGQWVTTFKTPKGEEVRTIRSYEWSFDRRVLIGRSFG